MRKYGLLICIFISSLIYAVLRYHVFKGISLEHFPLYISNKVLSVAAIGMIGCSLVMKTSKQRRRMGMTGFVLAGVHAMISLLIFTPRYYAKFFIKVHDMEMEVGKLTWQAELAMLVGVIGMVILFGLAMITVGRTTPTPPTEAKLKGRLTRLVLMFGALHVLFMGYQGWTDVSHWPGSMPPLTLISFVVAVCLLLASLCFAGRQRK